MTIQIINKNLINPELTPEYARHSLLNTKEYNIDEGAVINECYNETLDSATIKISNLNEKIDIEPFDRIILKDSRFDETQYGSISLTGIRYFVVDNYSETMTCVKPKIYQYEINLVSETKLLENIMLPNLRITQLKTGAKRTVAYYINLYMNQYGPKYRPYIGSGWAKRYIVSARVNNKFNIECPEFQWNQPTLREVLNDLMMVADCIPIIKNNYLYYLDLTEINQKGNVESDTHINYIQASQSSTDYVSEIKLDVKNVIQNDNPNIKNTVNRIEFIPFSSDSALLTDSNVFLKTQYPILNIKSLYICAPSFETDNFILRALDLTSYVYEYKEWQTLKIVYNDSETLDNTCQNITLYFNRGSNKINNLVGVYNIKGALSTSQITCYKILINMLHGQYSGTIEGNTANAYTGVVFKIEYETTQDCIFQTSKTEKTSNKRVIIDNQTNSYVNIDRFGNLEYQKTNRLGNRQQMLNARYESNFNTMLKIGDAFGDNILYQCQYQYYKNHIELNANMCENYVLKDYFTGIKSKIRSWKLIDGDEASIKHDLVKYYCEFSKYKKTELETYSEGSELGYAGQFLTQFTDGTIGPMRYCGILTKSGNTSYPASPYKYFMSDLSSRVVNKSIVFDVGFEDNFTVDRHIDTSNIEFSTFSPVINNFFTDVGGIPQQLVSYTDSNGEIDSEDIVIFKNLRTGNDFIGINDVIGNRSAVNAFLTGVYERPYLRIADIQTELKYRYNPYRLSFSKDNAEITKISLQFEFCSDTKDIYVNELFIKRQKAIRNQTLDLPLYKIYEGDLDDYDWRNPSIEEASTVIGRTISLSNEYGTCRITINNAGANKAYYITDANDNIILATKGISQFYLNILKDRDDNIYDGNGFIVGNIKTI